MKRFKKIVPAFFLIALLSLSSCGNDFDHHHEENVFLLSPDIRFYQVGDSINYFMTSTDRFTGAFFDGNVTWTIFDRFTNLFGLPCLVYDITGTLVSHNGLPPLSIGMGALIYQNGFGDLFECGKFDPFTNTVNLIVSSDANSVGLKPLLTSPVTVGNFQTSTVLYENGVIETCIISVDAIERVSTIRGIFDTFRISEHCEDSLGGFRDSVNWFYPPIYNVKGFSSDNFFDDTMDMQDFHLF